MVQSDTSRYIDTNKPFRGFKARVRNFVSAGNFHRKAGLDETQEHLSKSSSPESFVQEASTIVVVPRSTIIHNIEENHDTRPLCFIQTLPPEILGEIFIQCLPSEPYWEPRMRTAPLLLCQICRYWRHIALSLTCLWSSLVNAVGTEAKWSYVSLLKLWLARSCTSPLSLVFRPTRGSAAVMEPLLANVHRWRNVEAFLDAELASHFIALCGKDALLLESISIRIWQEDWDISQLIPTLITMPNLRRLEWHGEHVPIATFVNSSWPRLTHIRIDRRLSARQFVTLLSHCPSAQHVDVGSVSSKTVTPPITMPHLRFLRFAAYDTGSILDNFTLPSLLSLKVQQPEDPLALWRLDCRSSCRLESLDMHYRDVDAILSQLELPCMQSLQSLKLSSRVVMTETLVTLLTWNPRSHRTALPCLMNLELAVYKTTDGMVSDMIASRWRPNFVQGCIPAALQSVEIKYKDEYNDWSIRGIEHHAVDLACFQHLSIQGLKVSGHCWCQDDD